MKFKADLMDGNAVHRTLVRLSHEIVERNKGAENVVLVGIKRRGYPIALELADNIGSIEGKKPESAALDIRYYRDDLTRVSEAPVAKNAEFPFDVTDRDLVLVDDVIFTGRTARAAIEAVFSCGRPRTIQLAVLIDRGHRELPIRPDYVGKNIPTSRSEVVEVMVPEFDGQWGVRLMENV
ncbi:MAG: bifunctional pyr operon transcriptional regulator/uracil phosphoribosyltransferase PyrR [Oscillospiraceae bacterium]